MALFGASCTTVYFEKPVPASGTALTAFPADWTGLFIQELNPAKDTEEVAQVFRTFYRLERVSSSRLMISREVRIHEKDMPRLKKLLETEKSSGRLVEYSIGESFIFCTLKSEDENQPDVLEQQYTALQKKGVWYVLVQTMEPFRVYDLKTGSLREFEPEHNAGLQLEWMPSADSVGVKEQRLVALQHGKAWYFNTQAPDKETWTLLYVAQPSKDQLLVQSSVLDNPTDFTSRIDYFNTITPFEKIEDSGYLIRPTDPQLERLLAEKGLFHALSLRRIVE